MFGRTGDTDSQPGMADGGRACFEDNMSVKQAIIAGIPLVRNLCKMAENPILGV